MLEKLMSRVGGMRGVAAAAAIAWGASQAQTILQESTESLNTINEELAELVEQRDALVQELQTLDAGRTEILEKMRGIVNAEVATDVYMGRHDGIVKLRAAQLGWTSPAPTEPEWTDPADAIHPPKWCGGNLNTHDQHVWSDNKAYEYFCDGVNPTTAGAAELDPVDDPAVAPELDSTAQALKAMRAE